MQMERPIINLGYRHSYALQRCVITMGKLKILGKN